MRVTVLDDWSDTLRSLQCFRRLDGHDVTVWTDHVQDVDVLAERLREAEVVVLIRERTTISAELVAKLPALRLISQRSVYPHIDLEACTRAGIVVSSNQHPGAPSYAAAELTWALVLAAARQIPQQMASMRVGRWQTSVGQTLRGRTLGIFGYGRIGRVVAGYGAAFGMRVLVWSSEATRAAAVGTGTRRRPADRVLRRLGRRVPAPQAGARHPECGHRRRPGEDETDGAAGEHEPCWADRAGRPGGGAPAGPAGLRRGRRLRERTDDRTEDPLLQFENVITTPHIGYVTTDEFETQFADVFDQVVSFADGTPINVVNPAVLQRSSARRDK